MKKNRFVDNFDLIRKKGLIQPCPGEFYNVKILQRNKDMGEGNHLLRSFEILDQNHLDQREELIKEFCDIFHARAYICPTRRSYKAVASAMLQRAVAAYTSGNYNLGKMWDSACGEKTKSTDQKKFIVDIDGEFVKDLEEIKEIIDKKCAPWSDRSKIICEIPTLNGIHLITEPFNPELVEAFGCEVKKNNSTLLYCNLDGK